MDIMDAEGPDVIWPSPTARCSGKPRGQNILRYDSMLVLAHFKGHPAGGFTAGRSASRHRLRLQRRQGADHSAGRSADRFETWTMHASNVAFPEAVRRRHERGKTLPREHRLHQRDEKPLRGLRLLRSGRGSLHAGHRHTRLARSRGRIRPAWIWSSAPTTRARPLPGARPQPQRSPHARSAANWATVRANTADRVLNDGRGNPPLRKVVPHARVFSEALTRARREEIINACAELYKTMGFREITLKGHWRAHEFYAHLYLQLLPDQEEIFLTLLAREHRRLGGRHGGYVARPRRAQRRRLRRRLRRALEKRACMPQIDVHELYDMEGNSRIENLVAFKASYARAMRARSRLAVKFFPQMTEMDRRAFLYAVLPFLFGVYPYTTHTEKQRRPWRSRVSPRFPYHLRDHALARWQVAAGLSPAPGKSDLRRSGRCLTSTWHGRGVVA